jgi:hypothetical protein
MSSKKWAEEESSDEGSIDQDEEEIEVEPPKSSGAKAHTNPAPTQRFIAHISNICTAATTLNVGHFLESKGCSILRLDVHGDVGTPARSAVEFKDENSLNICLGLSGEKIMGELPIRVSLDRFDDRHHNRVPHQHQRGDGRGGGNRRPTNDVRGDRDDSHRGGGGNNGGFSGGRGGGGAGRGRGGARGDGNRPQQPQQQQSNRGNYLSRDDGAPSAASAPAATRPKLILQPRSKPLETIGKTPAELASPDIFGGGRAHDELTYEVSTVFQFLLYAVTSLPISC